MGRGLNLLRGMDLTAARAHIGQHLDRMSAVYRRPLFDEWAVLSVGEQTHGAPAYSGPRPDVFRRSLQADTVPLRVIAAGRKFSSGDFEFAVDPETRQFRNRVDVDIEIVSENESLNGRKITNLAIWTAQYERPKGSGLKASMVGLFRSSFKAANN